MRGPDLNITVLTLQWHGTWGSVMPRRSDHEDETILGIPDMLRIGTIPPQPEDTVDPTQVEAFGNRIVHVDWARHDDYGARWRPMPGTGLPTVTFLLVQRA
jgi:hypothetical protein